jgi:prepilin-type N-terminal cleavage/methylation domain-containing protein
VWKRYRLKKNKGFTLIELLVVIAIIAILVTIVIVAIDPAQRIRAARERRAASNVRATGTLLSVCVNGELSKEPPGLVEDCGIPGGVIDTYGNTPSTVASGDSLPDDEVCAAEQGAFGLLASYYVYRSTLGEVKRHSGELSTTPEAVWCPGEGLP